MSRRDTDSPNWGGRRPGSGLKPRWGEPTKPMRVPVSRMSEVRAYLDNSAGWRAILARWKAVVEGRTGPRWEKVQELLKELEEALPPE
jgi:hypothetical protein